MSAHYLGNPFDIHAGGDDLAFPHHENEIAQSEACFGTEFARYWLHGGMLTIDREKMSKSEGNFLLLKDVLEHVRPAVLRLLFLQTHYRTPCDYSAERLDEAQAALERIEGAVHNMRWAAAHADKATAAQSPQAQSLYTHIDAMRTRFKDSMDDDFNTAGAVAGIYELVSAANVSMTEGTPDASLAEALRDAADGIVELMGVLGVQLKAEQTADNLPAELVEIAARLAAYEGTEPGEALDALLAARHTARAEKDWTRADAVRDGLASCGITVEDTPQGPRIIRS
jgi:cysteinyl-tRNA synthetase